LPSSLVGGIQSPGGILPDASVGASVVPVWSWRFRKNPTTGEMLVAFRATSIQIDDVVLN
jgi:hypothetical protein